MQSVLYQLAGAKKTLTTLARATRFDFDVIDRPSARLNFLDDFAVSDAFTDANIHGATVVIMRMIVNSICVFRRTLAYCGAAVLNLSRPLI